MPTVSLIVSTTTKLAPLVSEALFRAGAQGLEERAGTGATLVTYDDRRANLVALWKRAEESLRQILPVKQLPRAVFAVDTAETWKTAWTEHLRPVELTRRLVLSPLGAASPPLRRDQRVLWYRPALAFGDGDHATTRLAARAIEAHYRAQPGGRLLDIGTGTGVLSLVALLSGARRALGTDVDARALSAARANAKLNHLAQRARFIPASARLGGDFDLVVINIELRPLLQVLARLPARARRAPRLLVTGILRSQRGEVVQALKVAGFTARVLRTSDDWTLLDSRP
jgi:ribosomal protein L11 methyltransferase